MDKSGLPLEEFITGSWVIVVEQESAASVVRLVSKMISAKQHAGKAESCPSCHRLGWTRWLDDISEGNQWLQGPFKVIGSRRQTSLPTWMFIRGVPKDATAIPQQRSCSRRKWRHVNVAGDVWRQPLCGDNEMVPVVILWRGGTIFHGRGETTPPPLPLLAYLQ